MCSPQSGTLRERFTEFHREEKKEEGDRGDQEERRGSQRRETNLACDQFPKFSQPRTPKEKGEGGDRGYLGKKKESQKRREQSSQ